MITIKVKDLKSFKEKALGLLFSKKTSPVFIQTRFGIHTFCLLFPIDVLVLSDLDIVVRVKKLKQNRIFLWNPKFKKIIELPAGEIERKKIKIGDKIKLEKH